MYREVESPEWFLLCLELGNPSSVSLPAVPMCYCCEQNWARVDTGALCDRFPLGSLEGFAIETFNSKEEGSGFFQVTHLAVCLTLNLPRCCFPYRQPHLSAAVSQSYCLTGSLLTLCPTVRAPPGSVSCSSVLLLRNQKCKMTLSSSSHAPLSLCGGTEQKVATDQCHLKGDNVLWFQEP